MKTTTKNNEKMKGILAGAMLSFALGGTLVYFIHGAQQHIAMSQRWKAIDEMSEEIKSHSYETTADNEKMLSSLKTCDNVEVNYSSMSSEVSTISKVLTDDHLRKLIENVQNGSGTKLDLHKEYWKSTGLKCNYRYTHKEELYKFLPN